MSPSLPTSFFARPAELVAPDLIGCRLMRRWPDGSLLWGVIVETEAYCQSEPACHGHRRRSPGNNSLFGAPGTFYVYVSYGVHHCVNVVTGRAGWANGVLLRAIALPGEPERVAAGPALLARRFALDRRHDGWPVDPQAGLWLSPRSASLQQWLAPHPDPPGSEADPEQRAQQDRPAAEGHITTPGCSQAQPLLQSRRIGISRGQELPWRWYLRASRSVSRRAPGDRPPRPEAAWTPDQDAAEMHGPADRP